MGSIETRHVSHHWKCGSSSFIFTHPPENIEKKKRKKVPGSDENKRHYCYSPLTFANFDPKFLTSYLNRMHTQTGSLPCDAPGGFFFRQVLVAFVFFRIDVSLISLGHKKRRKNKRQVSIYCLVHVQHRVKKSHRNTYY